MKNALRSVTLVALSAHPSAVALHLIFYRRNTFRSCHDNSSRPPMMLMFL